MANTSSFSVGKVIGVVLGLVVLGATVYVIGYGWKKGEAAGSK